jgi:RNA polymerase sigma-32 factor
MARENDSATSRYVTKVMQLPQLDRDAELALALRFKHHADLAARDALVRSQLRHVVAIALKYRRYGAPLSELIAEGSLGLVYALEKFEPERGNRLTTYASHWVRAHVLNHVLRSWTLVGGGAGPLRSKMFFKLRRERARIGSLLGEGEPADAALAARFGVPAEQLRAMLGRLDFRDVSLDAPLFDDPKARLLDTLQSPADDQEQVAAARQSRQRLREAVLRAVADLDERGRYIAENRLLADTDEELSLGEIGRRLGVSRERARQIEMRVKKKLRLRIEAIERDPGRGFLDSAA